jgi:hypothetical protein
VIFLGIKRPGRESDHSPPSSVEVKNGGAIPTLADMSSWLDVLIIKEEHHPLISCVIVRL